MSRWALALGDLSLVMGADGKPLTFDSRVNAALAAAQLGAEAVEYGGEVKIAFAGQAAVCGKTMNTYRATIRRPEGT